MIIEFEFKTEEEKNIILEQNKNLYLIAIKYLKDRSVLHFSDIPTIEILQKEQADKISILEEENETLKIELSITQDAVNELLFNTLNA